MSGKYTIKKYDYLDQLRWIAILWVVFTHLYYLQLSFWNNSFLDTLFSIGWMWVPLFFILSAYTLCLSHNSRSKKEKNIFLNFYLRRFFRIYPLFFLISTFVFILFSSLILFHGLDFVFNTDIKNWIFHVTFLFGFFPEYIWSMYLWEWSLFNELIFYICFPCLFLLTFAKKKYLFMSILFALFVSYGANVLSKTYALPDLYGTPITHMYSFLLGIWLFVIKDIVVSQKVLKILWYINVFSFIFLSILYIKFWYLHIYVPFILNLALFTFLFIQWFFSFKTRVIAIFLKFTGIISYSLYLINYWFYILIGIFFQKIIVQHYWESLYIEITFMLCTLIILFLLSYLSYKYIELKGIRAWKNIIEKYSQ